MEAVVMIAKASVVLVVREQGDEVNPEFLMIREVGVPEAKTDYGVWNIITEHQEECDHGSAEATALRGVLEEVGAMSVLVGKRLLRTKLRDTEVSVYIAELSPEYQRLRLGDTVAEARFMTIAEIMDIKDGDLRFPRHVFKQVLAYYIVRRGAWSL